MIHGIRFGIDSSHIVEGKVVEQFVESFLVFYKYIGVVSHLMCNIISYSESVLRGMSTRNDLALPASSWIRMVKFFPEGRSL